MFSIYSLVFIGLGLMILAIGFFYLAGFFSRVEIILNNIALGIFILGFAISISGLFYLFIF